MPFNEVFIVRQTPTIRILVILPSICRYTETWSPESLITNGLCLFLSWLRQSIQQPRTVRVRRLWKCLILRIPNPCERSLRRRSSRSFPCHFLTRRTWLFIPQRQVLWHHISSGMSNLAHRLSRNDANLMTEEPRWHWIYRLRALQLEIVKISITSVNPRSS